jgi:hypothetical protein
VTNGHELFVSFDVGIERACAIRRMDRSVICWGSGSAGIVDDNKDFVHDSCDTVPLGKSCGLKTSGATDIYFSFVFAGCGGF